MFRKDKDNDLLNKEIERALTELQTHKPETAMYTAATNNIEKLYKMKSSEKTHRVSPDVVVTVVANLLGIGLIVGAERAHAITSKAVGFVIKPRA